jgi:hypothetical protein
MMIWKSLAAALVCGTLCVAQTPTPPAEKPQPSTPNGKILFSSDNPATTTAEAVSAPVSTKDDGVTNAEPTILMFTCRRRSIRFPSMHMSS